MEMLTEKEMLLKLIAEIEENSKKAEETEELIRCCWEEKLKQKLLEQLETAKDTVTQEEVKEYFQGELDKMITQLKEILERYNNLKNNRREEVRDIFRCFEEMDDGTIPFHIECCSSALDSVKLMYENVAKVYYENRTVKG